MQRPRESNLVGSDEPEYAEGVSTVEHEFGLYSTIDRPRYKSGQNGQNFDRAEIPACSSELENLSWVSHCRYCQ